MISSGQIMKPRSALQKTTIALVSIITRFLNTWGHTNDPITISISMYNREEKCDVKLPW